MQTTLGLSVLVGSVLAAVFFSPPALIWGLLGIATLTKTFVDEHAVGDLSRKAEALEAWADRLESSRP